MRHRVVTLTGQVLGKQMREDPAWLAEVQPMVRAALAVATVV